MSRIMDCSNYSSTYFDKGFALNQELFQFKSSYEQKLADDENRAGRALNDEENGQVLQTMLRKYDENTQRLMLNYLIREVPRLKTIYSMFKEGSDFDSLKKLTHWRKSYEDKMRALDNFLESQELDTNNYNNFKEGLEEIAQESDEKLRDSIKAHDPLLPNIDKMTRQQLIEYANYVNKLYNSVDDKKDSDVQELISCQGRKSRESLKFIKAVDKIEKKRIKKEEERNEFFNDLGAPHLTTPVVENRKNKVIVQALRYKRIMPKDFIKLRVSPDDLRNAGMSDDELRAFGLIS